MWFKKLRKKKYQFILVALMLMFTSATFAACISFVAETSRYTQDYTSYQKCPQMFLMADEKYDREYFEAQKELMKETSDIRFTDITMLSGSFYCKDDQVQSFYTMVFHIEDMNHFIHDLKMIQGEEQKCPGYGEVWISSVCADSEGIEIGDILHALDMDGVGLKVSGIVATPLCASPYMGTTPFYVNEETAKLLDGTHKKGITLYTENPDISTKEYVSLIPEQLQTEMAGDISADDINLSISYLSDIFGGIGVLAATIIFVVSLVIIKFIITSTLAKEYCAIGTYKALGFTTIQIIGFYLKSFMFAGAIGITAGAVLSFPLAQYLCNSILRHLGAFHLTTISVWMAAGAVVILVGMLFIGIELSLRKIRKITPVEAFSIETASSKRKIGHSLIRNAYSPLSTAVNDIFKHKGSSILTVLILIVSFYMSIMFSQVNDSVSRMGENQGRWFNYPAYDAIIILNGEDGTTDYLDDSNLVQSYLQANMSIHLTGITTDTKVNTSDVYIMAYDDLSADKFVLPLLEGRNPEAPDEVMLSYDMLKASGCEIGDWIHLRNDIYQNDYLITATYSSMYNGGTGMFMYMDEYRRFTPDEEYKQVFVNLKNPDGYAAFKKDFEKYFDYNEVNSRPSFFEGSVNSINSISKPLTGMLVIIFALFSILNVVNLLLMNNLENRRQYGILKAMGFSAGYICCKNMLRMMLLTFTAALTALVFDAVMSQRIFFGVIHVEGLIRNAGIVWSVTSALTLLIFIVTLSFSLSLKNVAPTELMEE